MCIDNSARVLIAWCWVGYAWVARLAGLICCLGNSTCMYMLSCAQRHMLAAKDSCMVLVTPALCGHR